MVYTCDCIISLVYWQVVCTCDVITSLVYCQVECTCVLNFLSPLSVDTVLYTYEWKSTTNNKYFVWCLNILSGKINGYIINIARNRNSKTDIEALLLKLTILKCFNNTTDI